MLASAAQNQNISVDDIPLTSTLIAHENISSSIDGAVCAGSQKSSGIFIP
jgi:hypothetical protein